MRRMTIVIESIMLVAAWFLWNNFLGYTESVSNNGYSDTTTYVRSALHLPADVLVIGIIVIYLLNWIHVVDQRYRRPVMRFGKYTRTLDKGISLVEPLTNSTLRDVPVQDVVLEVPVENVQTVDNVGLRLVGVLTWRIDAEKVKEAVLEVRDVDGAVLQRALSTLTGVSGETKLDDFLANRNAYCQKIQEELASRVGQWGAQIKAFELKSFKINDEQIEKSIAMKARALKEAEAEITRAEKQEQIAIALDKAAKAYDEDGRWLKTLEVLVELCRSAANNTILIPTSLTSFLSGIKLPGDTKLPVVVEPAAAKPAEASA